MEFQNLYPQNFCRYLQQVLPKKNAFSPQIDLFHIVSAHAYIGHVARYFPIIGETLQRWGKRILSH